MLQAAGYRTAYVGKWHLGTLMRTLDGKNQGLSNVDYTKPLAIGPPQFGFGYSFILPGSLDMYPLSETRERVPALFGELPRLRLLSGGEDEAAMLHRAPDPVELFHA